MDISRVRSTRTLSLSQSRYAQKVIERFGLQSARRQHTPMDCEIDLRQTAASCTEPYRMAIGSLMYLMVGTRPDLAYVIGTLEKFMEQPTELHWAAVKRVIRYIIQTKSLGLVFGGTNVLAAPVVYVDADWTGDQSTRKSMSGYIAMMSDAAVARCARQQEVVPISSAESEYISMCTGAKETTWLRRLIEGLHVVQDINIPTTMFVDNQAAIAMAHSHAVNCRNKYIEVRFHYTRSAVEKKLLQLQYCPTDDMVADMLNNPLGRIKLQRFIRCSGLRTTEAASPQ